jgi:hypothetical protein
MPVAKVRVSNDAEGRSSSDRAIERRLVLIAALLYFTVFIVFVVGLRYNMFRTDVAGFWRLSLQWHAPFSTFWVPAYPLCIAIWRALTFDKLPPLAVMWPLAATFYLISVVAAHRILRTLTVPHAFGFSLVYAAFPVVGLVGAIYPVATNMAMAVFLLAGLALLRERWRTFGIYASLALITHKALWFSLLPLLLFTFVQHRKSRPWIVLSFVPLALLWIGGAVYLRDFWWMFSWSTRNLMWSPGALPVFDGLATSLLSTSAPKLFKGIFVLGLFLIALVSLYVTVLHRFWLGASMCLGTLGMVAVLNQHEILAAAHYARPLVIPAAYSAMVALRVRSPWTVRAVIAMFILGVLTNFGFAEYVRAYFFAGPSGGH